MKALDERIQRLLDGELAADEEAALRRSIAGDAEARGDLAALEGGLDALSSRPAPSLPSGFQARVMARVAARPGPRPRPNSPLATLREAFSALAWPRAAALATGLAVVFAFAGGLVGYRAGLKAGGALAASAAPGAVAPEPPAAAAASAGAEPASPVLVRFALTAPEARQVELAGTFNDWGARRIVLTRGLNGSWSAAVELPRGRYEYAFVVDGERFVADADAAELADDGFGSRNAVLDI